MAQGDVEYAVYVMDGAGTAELADRKVPLKAGSALTLLKGAGAKLSATTGLTVALAAQALGYDRGFSQTTFRAVQIGAQLIAPLALAWALVELTGKSLGARFTARLGLGALTVVGAVVLATDPLSGAAFSKNWPPASVHYQLIPNWVLEVVAAAAAVFAVVAVIVAGVRGRRSQGWRALFLAVAAVAAPGIVIKDPDVVSKSFPGFFEQLGTLGIKARRI